MQRKRRTVENIRREKNKKDTQLIEAIQESQMLLVSEVMDQNDQNEDDIFGRYVGLTLKTISQQVC